MAHGADLALQLVLNEAINAEQIKVLLAAVSSQLSPVGETFYIYGEPGKALDQWLMQALAQLP